MAHTYDNKQQFTTGAADPTQFSYTCGSGSTVLVLLIVGAGTTLRTGGAPTYNGVAFTPGDTNYNVETFNELWYMLDPPTGSSYTVQIQNDNTRTIFGCVASFKAASGYTSQLRACSKTTGTTADPGGPTMTSLAAGDVIVSVIGTGDNTFAPSGQTGTVIYTYDPAAYGMGSQYYITPDTADRSLTWTEATADDWNTIVASFKEVAATRTISITEPVTVTERQVIQPIPAGTPTEVLTDGGMETWTSATDLTNWTEIPEGSSTVNRESSDIKSGSYSCRFDVDGSDSHVAILQYSIPIPISTPCVMSFWYKVSGAGTCGFTFCVTGAHGAYLQLDGTWTSNSAIQSIPTSNGVWRFYSITFTSHDDGPETYDFEFRRGTAISQSVYIDDISIKKYVTSTDRNINITEPVAVGEASIGGLLGTLALSMVLAVGVGEVVTPQIYRQAAIVETITATESPPTVSLAPLAISITEPCTVGEARTLVLDTITLSAVHGVTVGESQTIGGIIPNTAIIEAIAVGEARTLGVGPPIIGITEPVTTGEAATGKASTLIAAITEPVTLTEIPTVEREAEPTRIISISESVGVAEVPAEIVGGLAKSISEPITVGEVQTLIAGALLKSIAEPVTVGEVQSLVVGTLVKSISESITTGESQALVTGALAKAITEPITVGEVQTLISGALIKAITEPVTTAEARTLVTEGPKASITEPVSISEVRTGIIGTAKATISEPVSVVEVAPIVSGLGGETRLVSISEPVAVAEVQTLLVGAVAGAVTESVALSEVRTGQVGAVLAEATSAIQVEEVPTGQVGALAGAITENVQTTESQTIEVKDAIKPVAIDILESVSVADIPTFFMYDETGVVVTWDVVLNRRAGVRSVEPRQRIFDVRVMGGRQ